VGTVPAAGRGTAPDDLQVTPVEFVVEHPTLINLGFEWHINGDANRNARVEVSFRKQGDAAWRAGMPLLRLHGDRGACLSRVPGEMAGTEDRARFRGHHVRLTTTVAPATPRRVAVLV